MNLNKIGEFIAKKRKEQNLTQLELAEKLCVTDRAVSKWETGKCMPDSSLMLDLCKILKISVNDLLNGEETKMEENKNLEQTVIELVKQKQEADRRLLFIEIILGIISTLIIFGATMIASFLEIKDWQRIVIIVVGVVIGFIGIMYCVKIEQVAGYYECKNCKHRYVPTYKSVNLAMHMGRTRYLKCPKCGQKTWNKKVIEKE